MPVPAMTSAADRNVIAGTGIHLRSGAAGTTIVGNYLGTDLTGLAKIGDGGINIEQGAHDTVVGGSAAGQRNVISGNNTGIYSLGGGSLSIVGNYIGVDATGNAPLPNRFGVSVYPSFDVIHSGGPVTVTGNVIS